MFQQENIVFKIFNKIPVSIRYPKQGYPEKEFFSYVLYSGYGGWMAIEEILDDVLGVWFNNKNGSEIIVSTKSYEKEVNFDGIMVYYQIQNIEYFDENIVKSTAKELGMTQKELAEKIGVGENTLGSWSRGVTETPKWALNHFELLKIERKYNTAKSIFCDID